MAKRAAKVATKPLLLSHTAVLGSRAMGPTPLSGRQVGPDYARAIAGTGGSVGVWHFFPSIDRYAEGLKEMAEIAGVDDVRPVRCAVARFTSDTGRVDDMLPRQEQRAHCASSRKSKTEENADDRPSCRANLVAPGFS